MHFWKAHAYGNDFLYAALADVVSGDLAELARHMCARTTGIGADGLILFERRPGGARMRLHNADGSIAEVSGNGVRGLAALLAHQQPSPVGTAFDIDTDAGTKHLALVSRDEQGRPVFRAAMGRPERLAQQDVPLGDETLPLATLWMGNPQAVWLVETLDTREMLRVGAALQQHPAFPDAVNLELAHVVSPGEVEILIYERGVGPTHSSGTGSCAAAVAAAAYGGAARVVDVVAPGGRQHVEWLDDGVYLTGWAEVLCQGTWLA
ncbi:Diaminopimelate epimerase [Luteitalea pratensis]|uniref:Diaminopimelate epimerase n=1 Tax=Luteitalea pratensis TaxID=1855912 RepID=A0A143PQ04_LUTPR|nr:diaminopimelate epimerase [Luteitalea pratensis]AMY10198.1 Diaminopimelate epimerase [Luteitalea pratensis]